MRPVRTSKKRPAFGNPVHEKEFPRFVPIPLSQPVDCLLPLSAIIGNEPVDKIQNAGQIVFHAVGDTGGIHGTEVQEALASAMEDQFSVGVNQKPAFFYHLGDVVYQNGQSKLYPFQFYEPYQYYPGVIFAIPGNHDGDTYVHRGDAPDVEPSLYGFTQNFCTPQRTAVVNTYRDTMTQPYVFWTLKAPFVTIIGLYSNVDGSLDGAGTRVQQQWLTDQLRRADQSTCIIIAVHHPPYSLDKWHGGYASIGEAIDQAAQASGVWPDAVFSGHVHNYQRFTRRVKLNNGRKKEIPYLIAGAGGYANTSNRLHKMQLNPDTNEPPICPFKTTLSEVELLEYNEDEPGFLRVTVTENRLLTEYFTVPFSGGAAQRMDSMELDYQNNKILQPVGVG